MTTAKVIEDSKSYNVAAKYVMGNVDFLANYLLRKSGLTSTQSGMSSTNAADFAANAKLIGLGVNYNLSKNTSIYGRYEKIVGLNATSSITSTVASNGAVSVQDYGNATQTKSMVGIRMAF
jgi:predicted porin